MTEQFLIYELGKVGFKIKGVLEGLKGKKEKW